MLARKERFPAEGTGIVGMKPLSDTCRAHGVAAGKAYFDLHDAAFGTDCAALLQTDVARLPAIWL